jgi:hypothetical protein
VDWRRLLKLGARGLRASRPEAPGERILEFFHPVKEFWKAFKSGYWRLGERILEFFHPVREFWKPFKIREGRLEARILRYWSLGYWRLGGCTDTGGLEAKAWRLDFDWGDCWLVGVGAGLCSHTLDAQRGRRILIERRRQTNYS